MTGLCGHKGLWSPGSAQVPRSAPPPLHATQPCFREVCLLRVCCWSSRTASRADSYRGGRNPAGLLGGRAPAPGQKVPAFGLARSPRSTQRSEPATQLCGRASLPEIPTSFCTEHNPKSLPVKPRHQAWRQQHRLAFHAEEPSLCQPRGARGSHRGWNPWTCALCARKGTTQELLKMKVKEKLTRARETRGRWDEHCPHTSHI